MKQQQKDFSPLGWNFHHNNSSPLHILLEFCKQLTQQHKTLVFLLHCCCSREQDTAKRHTHANTYTHTHPTILFHTFHAGKIHDRNALLLRHSSVATKRKPLRSPSSISLSTGKLPLFASSLWFPFFGFEFTSTRIAFLARWYMRSACRKDGKHKPWRNRTPEETMRKLCAKNVTFVLGAGIRRASSYGSSLRSSPCTQRLGCGFLRNVLSCSLSLVVCYCLLNNCTSAWGEGFDFAQN